MKTTKPIGIDGGETGFALRRNPSHSGDKGDGGVNTSMIVEMEVTPPLMSGSTNPAAHNARSGDGKDAVLIPEVSHQLTSGMAASAARMPHEQGVLLPEVCGTLSDGAHMGGGSTDKTPTLDASSRPFRMAAFGEYVQDETASSLKQRDYKDATDLAVTGQGGFFSSDESLGIPGNWIGLKPENGCNATTPMREVAPNLTKTDRHGVQTGMQVRRLTPTECARLQGFPDEYLNITFRNKPAANGNKYRALGNSMAVPCMLWIGKQIEKAVSYGAQTK